MTSFYVWKLFFFTNDFNSKVEKCISYLLEYKSFGVGMEYKFKRRSAFQTTSKDVKNKSKTVD